ncbi:MAG: dTDP-glucose 4,6-dehydratase [Spirochaetes bacterium]|nr:MAG: dTDP-glucose 4,6-dehydratase [Spirochaetota bacterium]
MEKILVTGGAGFIGSEFVRQIVRLGYKTIVVDKLTYAGDMARLESVNSKIKFYQNSIFNKEAMQEIFKTEKPDIVVNFAAETHVDRSILDGSEFIKTNVGGTQVLLNVIKHIGIKRFIHISTDEVYGDIKKGQFYETTPLNPSSPYSASKAAADLLVKSYIRTFKVPAIIIRPSNNYGQWQYPEKFIPVIIYKAINNQKVPVYGKGNNIREWLYVSDCAEGIIKIMERGRISEIYNLGGGNEKKNIEVVKYILEILKKPQSLIEFVKDRPGHDIRYSLNTDKLNNTLNWQPKTTFEVGIKKTVQWYIDNLAWLNHKVKYLKNYWEKVYK